MLGLSLGIGFHEQTAVVIILAVSFHHADRVM